jgi:hypothetical protein
MIKPHPIRDLGGVFCKSSPVAVFLEFMSGSILPSHKAILPQPLLKLRKITFVLNIQLLLVF